MVETDIPENLAQSIEVDHEEFERRRVSPEGELYAHITGYYSFNVGATAENYQVRDVAELVAEAVDGSEVTFAPGASADARDYRVDFSKIAEMVPGFRPQWTVPTGIVELRDAFVEFGLSLEDLEGERFMRIKRVRALMEAGAIDSSLRPLGEGT